MYSTKNKFYNYQNTSISFGKSTLNIQRMCPKLQKTDYYCVKTHESTLNLEFSEAHRFENNKTLVFTEL